MLWYAVVLAGLTAVSGVAFAGLIIKERDNTFCFSCHLHEAKFKRFT